ncbi:MAG: hypothetical protein EOM59_14565 [Clostridia bacterium]|nr:hypothetical protein [Clostridia bacterium]
MKAPIEFKCTGVLHNQDFSILAWIDIPEDQNATEVFEKIHNKLAEKRLCDGWYTNQHFVIASVLNDVGLEYEFIAPVCTIDML